MTKINTKQLVLTALFAAIIFLGTSFFKIQLAPKVIIHLGNALVVVSFLSLGYKYSMLSASIGFAIFDILNGYISSVHVTILESILVILSLHFLYKQLNYMDNLFNVILLSTTAGIVKIFIIFIRKLIMNYFVIGNDTSLMLTLVSMINTFITAAITVIMVPILYFALKKYIPNVINPIF